MRLGEISVLIERERERQENFVRTGRFSWTCADSAIEPQLKLAVLLEEIGEVARAIREEMFNLSREGHDLRTELVKVAAVAVAWLESLESPVEATP